jgi:pathogenesis-related protein 1
VIADAILITKELIVMKIYYLTAILVTVLFAAPAAAQLSQQDQLETLNLHNQERLDVRVPLLAWSTRMAGFAQGWANELARRDTGPVHRQDGTANPVAPGQPVGENIFWGINPGGTYSGADAARFWAREKAFYNNALDRGLACFNIPPTPPAPGCSPPSDSSCGHYCQIVWSNTSIVGCGRATARGGAVYVVCDYGPAGNFENQKPY